MRGRPLILVVDDTPENLEIVSMRLSTQPYEIATAADGEEGLEKAKALRPDLILLDIMMPKLDGIDVTRRLKGDASLPFIPIILLTAKSDAKDIVAGLEAGGDDYLTKPFDHSSLLARVRSMLRIKALHDKVQEQAAELASWNRTLEERVAAQLQEIERIGRLKRFPSRASARMRRAISVDSRPSPDAENTPTPLSLLASATPARSLNRLRCRFARAPCARPPLLPPAGLESRSSTVTRSPERSLRSVGSSAVGAVANRSGAAAASA
jgi:DNA-binding response OmpR family regulator